MKYTIRFQMTNEENVSPAQMEIYLNDLLNRAVLPTLNSEMVPVSLEVKKAR